MKELLKELKQRAENIVRQELGYAENALLPQELVDEKFAESLVLECVKVIDDNMPEFSCKEEGDNLYRRAGRLEAIDEIKDHFGVE